MVHIKNHVYVSLHIDIHISYLEHMDISKISSKYGNIQ